MIINYLNNPLIIREEGSSKLLQNCVGELKTYFCKPLFVLFPFFRQMPRVRRSIAERVKALAFRDAR